MSLVSAANTDRRHRFVVKRSRVRILEMEDLTFPTGRSIFLPDAAIDLQAETQERRVTGLAVFASALAFQRRFPDKKLWVAGHADRQGSASANLALSADRAENVQLFAAGDIDGWAGSCQAHYQVDDYQRVLAWIARTFGWNTDPGDIDNDFGDRTREARDIFRQRFQEEFDVPLERGVKQNEADWRAYAHLYELELARIMNERVETVRELRAELSFTEPGFTGCGEEFPRDRPEEDGVASASNRRVELVFFDPNEVPELPGSPPGNALYGTRRFVREYLSVDPLDDGGARYRVLVHLLDHWLEETLASTPYVLRGPLPQEPVKREGVTDENGILLETDLPSGHYTVEVDGHHALVLTTFKDPSPGRLDFANAVPVEGLHEERGPRPRDPEEEVCALEWLVPGYAGQPGIDLGSAFDPEFDHDGRSEDPDFDPLIEEILAEDPDDDDATDDDATEE